MYTVVLAILDLIWCYKIVFQCVNVNMSDTFQPNSYTRTRDHLVSVLSVDYW